jgi:hypothetical protein
MTHPKDMRVLREKMLDRLDRVDRDNAQRAHVAECLCPVCAAAQPVTDFEMANAMHSYGGSFCHALAQAWFHADEVNRAKIMATWADEVAEYRELARLKRAQAQAQA